MEISITKKGELRILAAKGKIRLQNWRVLDKHLANLREKGHRWLVMDLSDVSLICSTGIGSLLHNIGRFQDEEGALLLICTNPHLQEVFETFGLEKVRNVNFFTDWDTLETYIRAQGLAAPSA